MPKASTAQRDYTDTLDLQSSKIESGMTLGGHVALHNTSTKDLAVATDSPIEVVITKRGTRRVVGVFSGAIAGTGYAPVLSPGETKTVGIVGGTARCDGGIGSALPPGRYDAIAEVSGVGTDGLEEPGGQVPPTYFTQFVPIRIVK